MKYLDIIVKLRKIIRSINLESKRIEKQFGVSIPQLMSLQYLSEQEDYKATASQLKAYLKLNASTMSGIVSRLEQKSLVARLRNPQDRRATFITLTAKGAELLKDPPGTLQEKLTARLSKLSPERIASLNEHIDLLVQIMDADDLDASPIITTKEIGKE
ncbi:MAG: MarR family winged helix-turn-helix transcriptional regulator [Lewinella sp.]|jgi:DNA-binding MarR family transcriptional regulator|uniref:MarR family winged helix-turn-helix transcriptional regulator n=1 Tax=Lewinella sp. TaxID=2004506 RepID=UPI003D6A52B5